MIQLTVEIPDELAERLYPVQDRLAEIIELGLRELTPTRYGLYGEVVEFLGSGPSPQDIVAFHPSQKVIERVTELLDKNKSGQLTGFEETELDHYENLDYLMTLIKARAQRHLGSAG